MRRLRFQLIANDRSADRQRSSLGFGFRFGYWPCLRAPYLQLALGTRRVDIWYGDPSYKHPVDV